MVRSEKIYATSCEISSSVSVFFHGGLTGGAAYPAVRNGVENHIRIEVHSPLQGRRRNGARAQPASIRG